MCEGRIAVVIMEALVTRIPYTPCVYHLHHTLLRIYTVFAVYESSLTRERSKERLHHFVMEPSAAADQFPSAAQAVLHDLTLLLLRAFSGP